MRVKQKAKIIQVKMKVKVEIKNFKGENLSRNNKKKKNFLSKL